MLAQRLLTTVLGVPIIVALIVLGGALYTAAVAVILVLAVLEFYAVTDPVSRPLTSPGMQRPAPPLYRQRAPALLGAGAVLGLAVAADRGADEWAGAFAAAVGLIFLYQVAQAQPLTGLRDWLWAVSGVAYVGYLGSHLVFLRALDDDGRWTLLAVFSTFGADTAAYLVGRAVGRIHIAPAISPGKTLEGTAAGLIGGFASVVALNQVTGLDAAWRHVLPLGILLPVAAVLGDLAESLIKRGAGVKDTSDLIPGHGGFLDRIDAVLFTTPLVYYFVIWAVR